MADIDPEKLLDMAMAAAQKAYAPYSQFHVGAALLFDDGTIVTGANFENASYGLSLCAETAAIVDANHRGLRSGLLAIAVHGGPIKNSHVSPNQHAITPCGRCRQMINEVAQLGDTDPIIYCGYDGGYTQHSLSVLLPVAFGPANLND
jgi:cytidine deaminase